ncbi:hypothetical protein [Arcobacter sp. CECT 8985]|uniref:hypothetical protein n=1 Tax=Arcobacter sp. CECT 8985 TaxID=1935424 RepID=UPI00100B2F80|nr:hypothetical protein [Arcobacter sp. CECT 8985]RXJ83329.1 hypothetical protein CRU93_13915 [Arcobacter sp. CECT 8985]
MSKVTISEFIISVVELIEAQIKEVESSFVNSAKGLLIKLFSLSLLVMASIFFFLGIKVWIESYLGEIFAYFITAFVILILALIVSKVASWKIEQKR